MKSIDFDKVIDRKNTYSMKWDDDSLEQTFGRSDILPMWVADMDFRVAQPILDAMQGVLDHGILGYSGTDDANKALIDWMDRRHQWSDLQLDWIVNTPGVVSALNIAVQAFTQPGDKVLVQRPVYYPFTNAAINNGRMVVSNSLIQSGTQFTIDFDDFAAKASDPDTKLLILCSPHNPVSRVFKRDELIRLLDIAFENNLTVVVDEIHGDLVMGDQPQVTIGQLPDKYVEQVITCLAPSKTFNLAGTQWSAIVIPDPIKRHAFKRIMEQNGMGIHNPLSLAAVVAAYNECEDWLDELIPYIKNNFTTLKTILEQGLPGVRCIDFEATYLAYVDFNALGISDEALIDRITNHAKVGLDAGSWFGEEGRGFMRFNLACPNQLVEQAANQIVAALHDRV